MLGGKGFGLILLFWIFLFVIYKVENRYEVGKVLDEE